MKKILLILAIISLPLLAFSQTTEKQYYIYNIITFSGNLKNEGFKVDVDNGKTIEKLKDASGKKINFKTPAAALMSSIRMDGSCSLMEQLLKGSLLKAQEEVAQLHTG